jgi:hypothetical protein
MPVSSRRSSGQPANLRLRLGGHQSTPPARSVSNTIYADGMFVNDRRFGDTTTIDLAQVLPHALDEIAERGFCLLEHAPTKPPALH